MKLILLILLAICEVSLINYLNKYTEEILTYSTFYIIISAIYVYIFIKIMDINPSKIKKDLINKKDLCEKLFEEIRKKQDEIDDLTLSEYSTVLQYEQCNLSDSDIEDMKIEVSSCLFNEEINLQEVVPSDKNLTKQEMLEFMKNSLALKKELVNETRKIKDTLNKESQLAEELMEKYKKSTTLKEVWKDLISFNSK